MLKPSSTGSRETAVNEDIAKCMAFTNTKKVIVGAPILSRVTSLAGGVDSSGTKKTVKCATMNYQHHITNKLKRVKLKGITAGT